LYILVKESDAMETEEQTVTATEDESETYNYPASELLRNDVNGIYYINIKLIISNLKLLSY